jgi:hypothetical protein
MGLSRKAKEQEAALQQLEAQVYGDGKPAPTTPAADTAPETTATPADTPVTPTDTPVEGQPTAASDAAVKPDDDPNAETWQTRFRVLQGKYSAEVPRLAAELAALKAELARAKEAPPPDPQAKLIKPEEIEQYGEGFFDMVQRAAEEKFGAERTQLMNTIAELTAKVDTVVATGESNSKASFYSELTRLAPDWKTVDENQAWRTWLAEYDPDARRQRQDLLNDAMASGEADYVAKLIAKWKLTQRSAPAPNLETMTTPSTSRSTSTPTPVKGRTWTSAEVDQFYHDYAKGKISETEGARIEQDIALAVQDGRYRPR